MTKETKEKTSKKCHTKSLRQARFLSLDRPRIWAIKHRSARHTKICILWNWAVWIDFQLHNILLLTNGGNTKLVSYQYQYQYQNCRIGADQNALIYIKSHSYLYAEPCRLYDFHLGRILSLQMSKFNAILQIGVWLISINGI